MSDRHNDDAGNGGGGIRVGDVRPGEPPVVHITPSGVVVNEADGATWYAKDGSTVTLRADCSFELKDHVVERIEIDDALLPPSWLARAIGWLVETGHRVLAAVLAISLVAGCSSTADDLVPDKSKIGVPVSLVMHYGTKIGIPDAYINGLPIGSGPGWGEGGGLCCVLLSREIPKAPVMVKVKWITYRSNVEERLEHEVTVPVNFAVKPGESSGAYVHLLPGHRAEVWVSWPTPASTEYPGPAYPRGPGPVYVPLPGERPQPSSSD